MKGLSIAAFVLGIITTLCATALTVISVIRMNRN